MPSRRNIVFTVVVLSILVIVALLFHGDSSSSSGRVLKHGPCDFPGYIDDGWQTFAENYESYRTYYDKWNLLVGSRVAIDPTHPFAFLTLAQVMKLIAKTRALTHYVVSVGGVRLRNRLAYRTTRALVQLGLHPSW